jgi:DNA polymerase III subunit delta'
VRFAEIPGNVSLKKQLIQQVQSNRVAHAQLFYKADGPGTLAMCIAFAQYLICSDKQENDACGKCSACQKVEKLIHPDVMFVLPHNDVSKKSEEFFKEYFVQSYLQNPFLTRNEWQNVLSSKKTAINYYAADLKNAITKVKYKPFEAPLKVMIFWLPELFGNEGNILLKVFEEPPENTIFLLATEEYDAILRTIQSRFQLKRMSPFLQEDIAAYLVEKHGIEQAKANHIALCSNGDMSQALALLEEQEIDYFNLFREWMRLCFKGNDFNAIFTFSKSFDKLNKEQKKGFLTYALVSLERSILELNHIPFVVFDATEKNFYQNFSKYMTPDLVQKMSGKINDALYHLQRNANPNMLFADLSLSIIILIRDIRLNSLLI